MISGRALVVAVFLLIAAAGACAAEREIAFTVTDGDATGTIYVGLDPTATNGIDPGLGELLLPPLPPAGAFDVRWIGTDIGVALQTGVLNDYRAGGSSSNCITIHEMLYQAGAGSMITIGWSLPSDVTARLQDLITGYVVNVQMTGTGSYVITNPGIINKLKVTVAYKPLQCALKVFLEGPYHVVSGEMLISLKSGGHLGSHFGGMPIPGAAVDSINIEIRDAESGSGSTIRRYSPAWLLADGSIRMFSDTTLSYVEFDAAAGNYFVVVRHRNHLAIMSKGSVGFVSATISQHDFTVAQDKAYGDAPTQQLATGVYGMYSGDADGSGAVGASDRTAAWNQRNQTGYQSADVDFSGQVGASDRTIIWNNRNKSTKVPG